MYYFAKVLEDQEHVVLRLSPSTALKAVYIIDGMALVQMIKSAGASSFGKLACKFYASVTAPLWQSNCNEVHVIFDQCWESSIKGGGERMRRGSSSLLEVHIHGPSTPIPKQWAKYIPNPQCKVNLCDFVTATMSNLGRENMAISKKLIGQGLKDGERTVCITNTTCEDLEELRSNMKRQTPDPS